MPAAGLSSPSLPRRRAELGSADLGSEIFTDHHEEMQQVGLEVVRWMEICPGSPGTAEMLRASRVGQAEVMELPGNPPADPIAARGPSHKYRLRRSSPSVLWSWPADPKRPRDWGMEKDSCRNQPWSQEGPKEHIQAEAVGSHRDGREFGVSKFL